MKAISLHQPWASLIAVGAKTVETRSWRPPLSLIGERIAIHAAKKKSVMDAVLWQPLHGTWNYSEDMPPLGKVVATAILRCAHQVAYNLELAHMHPGTWMECAHWRRSIPFTVARDAYGDFTATRWLWFLEDIKRLDPPVPAKGHQGFWNWE